MNPFGRVGLPSTTGSDCFSYFASCPIYHFLVELIRMEEGPHNGSPHGFQFPQRFKNFLDIFMVIAVWAILYSRILLYFATSALVRGR